MKKDYQPIEPKFEIPRIVRKIVIVAYVIAVSFCVFTVGYATNFLSESKVLLITVLLISLMIYGISLSERIFKD